MHSVHIAPYPPIRTPNIQVVEGALSPEQCKTLRDLGEEMFNHHGVIPGRVGFNDMSRVDRYRRVVDSQWLPWPWEDERMMWVYEAMSEIIQQVNARVWQVDVTDWVDKFHYLRYRKGGHFRFHQDAGDGWRKAERKLAFSLLLSNLDEYEGGDLQYFDAEPISLKRLKLGDMAVFHSHLQHQVTKVTKGVRRSLVGWASGPKWK